MRRVLLLAIGLFFTFGVSGQNIPAGFDLSNYGVRIEPDKRLITVLATLEMATARNAAGVDEKLINTPLSERGSKFRDQVIADNRTAPEDLRRKISAFVAAHKKRNPKLTDAELVAPFISMAYALTPVPELSDPVITNDLPGSLLDVLDFAPLVREFYRRSPIASRLDDYVKDYRLESDLVLRTSAREMVKEMLDYLHTRPRLTFAERVLVETQKGTSKKETLTQTEIRESERRFFLVPERLAPTGAINFVNIRDDYYVIVPPDTDLSNSDARRAFLRFVIDPLVLTNSNEVAAMRTWAKPLLDELRKTDPTISIDPFRAISRSLVTAIDVRQAEFVQLRIATEQSREAIDKLSTDAEKRALSANLDKFKQELSDEATLKLYEDYKRGSVLAFYFAEQLKGIEDSGFDIAASLREMIASFAPAKETERVAATAEPRRRAIAAREERKKNPDARTVAVENPVTTRLLEIQKTIDSKDYAKADADLKKLLAQNPNEPRIYYNLGRVAGLIAVGVEDADLQARILIEAKNAYSNVIKTATASTDRALLSLTYVALARIYEFQDQNDYALKLYDRAIELTDVPGGGFRAAMDAKARLIKPQ